MRDLPWRHNLQLMFGGFISTSFSRSAAAALFIFTGLNLLNYVDRYVMPAVLTPLQKELKLTDSEAGIGMAAFMFGYFLSAPLFGVLGDRYSRKLLMIGGVLVWSLATAATALADDLWQLVAIRIFVGVGEACFVMISPAWISDLYPSARRNNALAIYSAAVPFGSALSYVIGGWFGQQGWWREAFLFTGLPGLLLVLTLLLIREPMRGEADGVDATAAAHDQSSWREFFSILRNRSFLLLTAGYAALVFAIGAFADWGPQFLEKMHGIPIQAAATHFGAMLALMGTLATLCGGAISSSLRRRTSSGYAWVLTGSLLLATPMAFFAFITSSSLFSQLAIGACMFFLFLPTAPCLSQLFEIVPIHNRAKANALLTFFLHLLGDLPSPILVGQVSDLTHSLRSGVLILPPVLLIGAAFWYGLVRQTAQAQPVLP